jgi:phage terminase Nu1 subunit (DNA packaging protein)
LNIPPEIKPTQPTEIKPIGKVGNKSGEVVTMSALAHLFGVTPRTIKNWVNDGMPCEEQTHGKSWLFDSALCFKWRLEREVNDLREKYGDSDEGDSSRITFNEAKRRSAVATMHLDEMKFQKESGELAVIEDLVVNFSAVLIQIRAKLVSLASRRSGLLTHKDQDDIEKILNEEVSEILEAMTDYEHSFIESE